MKLAYSAGKLCGSATVCLNGANEEAVFAFLNGDIKLYDIYFNNSSILSLAVLTVS